MNIFKYISKKMTGFAEPSASPDTGIRDTDTDAGIGDADTGDADTGGAGFPGFMRSERSGLVLALAVAALAFGLFYSLLTPVCLPGAQAEWLMQMTGEMPLMTPRFSAWRGVAGAFVALFPAARMVFAANLASAVFGALCVGLAFWVTYTLVYLMMACEDDGEVAPGTADEAFTDRVCLLGGGVAAAVLACSTIFMIVSTQAYFQTFYMAWILGAGYLMLRYMVTGAKWSLFAFCVAWGAGLTQHAWFALLTPVLFGLLVARQLAIMVFDARLAAWMAVAVVLGGGYIVAETLMFKGSEGFHLLRYGRYAQLFYLTASGLVAEVTGMTERLGWLLVFGVTALPFGAMLVLGRRSLQRESNAGLLLVNVFVLVAALINMFNLRASVWRSFGYANLSAISCVMTAMTFGFCVVFFVVRVRHAYRADKENAIEDPAYVLGLRLKWLLPVLFAFPVLAVAPVYSAVSNIRHYDLRGAEFLQLYIDRILDEAPPRVAVSPRWIVSDRVFADLITLRAHERGLAVETIDVSRRQNDEIYTTLLARKLPDDELRASLTLGIEYLLNDWVRSRASAPDELLFTLYHYAWVYGGYAAMPAGVAFTGMTDAQIATLDAEAAAADCMAFLDTMATALDAVPDSGDTSIVPRLAEIVRARTSLAANNLAYRLETAAGYDAAALYRRVSEFDPGNISAFINHYSGIATDDAATRDALQSRLAELKDMAAKMSLLAVVFKYGDIRLPDVQTLVSAQLARAGRDDMAAKLLEHELAQSAADGILPAHMLYADLAMKHHHTDTAREIYEKASETDAGRHAALLNLFRISLTERDREKAADCLRQLAALNLPPDTLLASRATFHMIFDELDDALEHARRLILEYPENPAGYVLRCDIFTRKYHAAQTDDERRAILETLNLVLDNLVLHIGADNLNTLMVKARIELLTDRPRDARFTYLRAARLSANSVTLMEPVLKIDLLLDDHEQALDHAKTIVMREPRHALANYVLARDAYTRKHYDTAKIFLNRAASRGVNDEMRALMNDIETAQAEAAETAQETAP